MSLVFVDTNIIAYARDAREPLKQPIAERWLTALANQRRGRISWPVLCEYYAVATHPKKRAINAEMARADIRALAAWNPMSPDVALIDAAFRVQDRYGFSWWDSLIVAVALISRCGKLLSEDLQHNQVIDEALTIVNPFAADAPQPA